MSWAQFCGVELFLPEAIEWLTDSTLSACIIYSKSSQSTLFKGFLGEVGITGHFLKEE